MNRVTVVETIYPAIIRFSGRAEMFHTDGDYQHFILLLP